MLHVYLTGHMSREDIETYSNFALTARLMSQFLPAVPMHAGKKTITWPNGEAPQVARSKAAFVLFKAEQGWEADQAKAFPPLNHPQGATARLPH